MVIRFQCAACSQPIEVDAEWALKTVACPYCRRTVTAPAESTLVDLDRIPTASPLSPPGGTALAPSSEAYTFSRPGSNPAAIAAFALACGLVMLLGLGGIIMAPHALELQDIQKDLQESAAGGAPQWKVLTEYMERHGGRMPTWLIAAGAIELAAVGTWLAAIICAIIGLRRPGKRIFAMIAMIISGGVFALFCLSTALSFG